MKLKGLLFLVTAMAAGAISIAYADSGNGMGTSKNCGDKIKIYHRHGNGTYDLMYINPQTIDEHAGHGDIWYNTGCPLTGTECGCY